MTHDELVYALKSGILITDNCRSEAIDRLDRYLKRIERYHLLLERTLLQLDDDLADHSNLTVEIQEALK